jgi:hypothetical protein
MSVKENVCRLRGQTSLGDIRSKGNEGPRLKRVWYSYGATDKLAVIS